MLGAAGWPLSELFDRSLASKFNLEPFVDGTDRAPSILHGGLGKVSPYYWVTITILAIAAFTEERKKTIPAKDYFPGSKLYPVVLFCIDCIGLWGYLRGSGSVQRD